MIGTLTLSDSPSNFSCNSADFCKSWNSLISNDPDFAKKHLRKSPTKRHLFFTSKWVPINHFTLTSYPLDSLHLDAIFTSNPTQLDYSLIDPKHYDALIASCDGLFCFAINNTLAALWNPTIRKVKELPSLDIPPQRGRTIYAFGYDPFIHRYKAVSAVSPNGILVPLVAGSADVVGEINRTQAIVSLHLGKESYQEISQPDYGMPSNLTLGIMKDCLCVFSCSDSLIDVWLMKEYGNKESWIKLIHLPFSSSLGLYCQDPKMVYISEDDNNVLLLFREFSKLKWVVYDRKYHTTRTIKIEDFSWVNSKLYVESLVSP
ncbi:F-box/kelch-repeat protein At3g23880 [Medicago truncatula]|uniref:F-box/kelch-repeat protein At3g23880 n=1 Tax=Medicago truncatula TaxID=3880 RepID=UPI000D2F3553|nr:F-box/kelch-repeat protein At3g23880 [Medicago truncatula]